MRILDASSVRGRMQWVVIVFFIVLVDTPKVWGRERIRVATFNLRNYLITDRLLDGGFRPAYPKPEHEKQAIRKIIGEVRPDVLALQEMGGPPFLREFLRDLSSDGLEFPFSALFHGSDGERHTAIISRIPFEPLRSEGPLDFNYFGERLEVKRGLQQVAFRTAEIRWHLFNLHLKSRRTERKDDPEARLQREGESRAIRDYIKRILPPLDRPLFLIVGDLNDTRDSRVVRQLLRSGPSILSEEIPVYDSRGELWTYYYARSGTYSKVDYILSSPALARSVIEGKGTVVDMPASEAASDHRMLFIDLEF